MQTTFFVTRNLYQTWSGGVSGLMDYFSDPARRRRRDGETQNRKEENFQQRKGDGTSVFRKYKQSKQLSRNNL
jgi:hypothetical protein